MSTVTKVLLIDDEPFWNKFIAQALKAYDKSMDVTWVTSVKEAQSVLRKEKIDLIICDQNLNEGEPAGIELWKSVQKTPAASIPFMMVSGINDAEFLGIIGESKNFPIFINKEYGMLRFHEVLKTHFTNKSSADQRRAEFNALLKKMSA